MLRRDKFVLSDEQVELYIDAFFKVSPRSQSGTAPAGEWLQFLDLFNEREGHYVLRPREMEAIRPYCEANAEVEMTPMDFIQLIQLVRHNKIRPPPLQPPRPAMEARPRSSRLLTRDTDYYDPRGRSTPNHPSLSNGDSSGSVYSDNEEENERDHERNNARNNQRNKGSSSRRSSANYASAAELEALKKNHIQATKQVKEYESREVVMTKEHAETIAQLQTRLEYLNIEAAQQKAIVEKQKQTERDRMEKIGLLERKLLDADTKFENAAKKLERRQEDISVTRSQALNFQEKLHENEKKLIKIDAELAQAKVLSRQSEKDKVVLQAQLKEERVASSETESKLKNQQNENTKLLEIIDRQKFDLDEARSGLRYHTASPALDKELLNVNQSKTGDSSLAQEQLEAKHMKEIELLEEERDQYKEKSIEQEKEVESLEKERDLYKGKTVVQGNEIKLLQTGLDKYKENILEQEKYYNEKLSLLRKEQDEDRQEMEKEEKYQQELSKNNLNKQQEEYIRLLRALERERDQYKEDMMKQRDQLNQGSSQSNLIEKIKLLEEERDQYKKDIMKQRDQYKEDMMKQRDQMNQGSSQNNSIERTKLLEAERDKYKEDMAQQEIEFNQRLAQTVNDQEAIIQNLREEFERQQALIDNIHDDVLFIPRSKAGNLLTAIAWIFLAYHTSMLLASTFYLGPNKNTLNNLSFYFLKRLSEWYTSCVV